MNDTLDALSEHLKKHENEIISRWELACEEDCEIGTVTRRLTHKQFVDDMPASLEQLRKLVSDTQNTTYEDIRIVVAEHGHDRWKQGFNLRALIRDWGILNRILTNVFTEFFINERPNAHKEQQAALDILALFITEAGTSSVRRFEELRQAEAGDLVHALKETTDKFDQTTRARGRLLREAAHDIRGNLSAIAGASSLLKYLDSAKMKLSLDEVLDSLDRGINAVKDMLNDLLDLSRLEAGEERLDLLTADIDSVLNDLAETYKTVATKKGLELHISREPGMTVKTDPGKVRRIAQNLITNALEYTKVGHVAVSWSSNEHFWQLTIEDTGPGIQDIMGSAVAKELDDPDNKPHHLNDVHLCAYSGEGVGLTIVKRLCEMMDAGVSVKSEMGKGTVFRVEFPHSV